MSSNKSKQLSTYFFTFIILLAALAVTYSLSSSTVIERSRPKEVPAKITTARLSFASSFNKGDAFLVKDDKLVIGKTCLDFKGLDDDSFVVDFYLLDLDDEQPYPKKISRDKIGKEIHFGDYTYTLVSVNDRFVKLKLEKFFSTP